LNKLQAIKGMKDVLPGDSPAWQYLESRIIDILQSYGYQEIRTPIIEQTELFKRGIGEATDVVEKEMYTFEDRYTGPMFRHEKPQKGRLRQFHQFGVEAFGYAGPDIDAEMLIMTARLWKALGIDEHVELHLNSLGTSASRAHYRKMLVAYFESHIDQLDEDSKRRLHTNPLRIFDSKVETTRALLADAPKLDDYLDDESQAEFEQLKTMLDDVGVKYVVDPTLVRGLDYYSKTVFEWITTKLGSQGTVCGGGRYDGLIQLLGGKPTSAIGFGIGVERLILLLTEMNLIPEEIFQTLDVYILAAGVAPSESLKLGELLRENFPSLRVHVHCGGGSFKSQMKKADRSGALFGLILGEDEVANESVTVKFLREDKEQITVKRDQLNTILI